MKPKPRIDFPTFTLWTDNLPAPLIEVVGGTTYYGYADWGTEEDEPAWMLIKAVVAGGITTTTYAGGKKGLFDYKWSDRAAVGTLYSR